MKRFLLPILLAVGAFVGELATVARGSAGGRPVTSRAPSVQRVWETFYAARDNDPPGSRNIAYPGHPPRHERATADQGTYAHPITLAADKRWLPVGTIVYAPRWRKYYVMEDQCVPCEADWARSRLHHVDLYISSSVRPAVLKAEDEATKEEAENDIIILKPPPNLAVDTTPLYTDASGSVVAQHQYSDTLVRASRSHPPHPHDGQRRQRDQDARPHHGRPSHER
ncbi:MAG TPA: hypothetical protein VFQ25_11565 [Ktedonobacterales bacterium]|nr:hypothetical protein [Ktedonobacterales bacterium]